jgi:hypothetical protein
MAGELDRPDPRQLRISDADRHQVAEILREAAGEGRLELDELDERLEATYAARTYADLVPITADLPAHPARPAQLAPIASADVVPGAKREQHFAIMSGVTRKGVWVVPEHFNLFALMGGAELDLRDAKFAAHEVVLTINAFMGGANVIVGPNVRVQVEGTGIMGGYAGPSGLVEPEIDENSPVVRVRGLAIWGGVNVERKHSKRSDR